MSAKRHIQANLGREKPKHSRVHDFSPSSLVITPRSVMVVVIFFLVAGAFFYIYREFRSFAAAPRLVILEPGESAIVEMSEVVVRGKTDKGARVSINNQPVFVASEGDFTDKLTLQPGLNTIAIVAVNRFDKEKSETLSVEARYTPSVSEPVPSSEAVRAAVSETFSVTLSVRERATNITLEADGTLVFSGVLKPEEMKTIEGKEKIVIAAENGDQTFVRFNNGPEEALSLDTGPLKGVIFTPAGRR
jgi:hypothetical protein